MSRKVSVFATLLSVHLGLWDSGTLGDVARSFVVVDALESRVNCFRWL